MKLVGPGLLLLVLLTVSTGLRAQEQTVVDLFRGPVVSSARVTGLAGAYVGVAEGVQGVGRNAASMGNRYPYSTDWFDYDFALDWVDLLPGATVDMDNDGVTSGDESYRALSIALSLLFGKFGIGAWVSGDTYTVADDWLRIDFGFTRGYVGVSYAFWREQLVAGLGLASANLDVSTFVNKGKGEEPSWEEFSAGSWSEPGGRFGLLWRPLDLPVRVGVDATLPVTLQTGRGEDEEPELVDALVPGSVYLPWRLAAGVSYHYSFAGHPYNLERAAAGNPYRAQAAAKKRGSKTAPVDRRYVLAALDVFMDGPAPAGAVGSGSYATGSQVASGKEGSLSLHAGVESEVLNNRLVVRGGSYVEPARLEGAEARVHGTLGADVRLFKLWLWQFRAGVSFDAARDYLNWGVGLGFWH